jgi:hypothetical protein
MSFARRLRLRTRLSLLAIIFAAAFGAFVAYSTWQSRPQSLESTNTTQQVDWVELVASISESLLNSLIEREMQPGQ